ncbi:MAG: LytTR family DNA-binding domain-containing protein [Pseudomonadota bacterium]
MSSRNGFGVSGMEKIANSTVWAQTLDELRVAARQTKVWAVLLIGSLVVGVAGPFGTFDALPLALRGAYWLIVGATTFWLGFAVFIAVSIWAEARQMVRLAVLACGAAAGAVPITLWLAVLHTLLFDQPMWADALRLFPYVLVIAPTVAWLSEAMPSAADTPNPTDTAPAWLAQLPHHLGQELLVLRAEDHYLRADTALGSALIRGRLSDAADALGGYGLRIHRSWWVARRAIASPTTQNGVMALQLVDGRVLPVGRTYRKTVRAALRRPQP